MALCHGILDYLEGTWLYRTHKFFAPYTLVTPHFGNSLTSRVEGAHHQLKNFLDGSQNYFITCFKAFQQAGNTQAKQIMVLTGVQDQKTILGVPASFRKFEWSDITLCTQENQRAV